MSEQENVEKDNNERNQKLRDLLSKADLASDNTSATPAEGKSDSEYLENRPPHHG
jgi:hypothetical protein